jgi:hypothetical protein
LTATEILAYSKDISSKKLKLWLFFEVDATQANVGT